MLKDLLRSSPFRITILYTLLFIVSSMIMLTFIYVSASREFRKTLQSQIANETALLHRTFQTRGYAELVETIQERSNAPTTSFFLYAIADASGKQAVGNLPGGKLGLGWREVTLSHNIVDPEDDGHTLLMMYGTPLGDGTLLVVGAGLDQGNDLRALMINSLFSSLAFILPMVLVSGILLSRAVLARVSTIDRASKRIMAGDLSRRLPISGSSDEFDQLSGSMNSMLDRIEELMTSMKQVTTDIAHDLRTPIGRLRQQLESAEYAVPSAEAYACLVEKVKAETDQILRTFDALLQIGQISATDIRKRFTAVDLSELVSELAESYQAVAAEKNQHFSAKVAPGISVRGQRELLAQMLVNLIENAINHSPEGASISLWLGAQDGSIQLIVADTGPGIPPEHRTKIFQPFYRLERSRKTPGSGLGLALVRSVAKIYGISIALGDNGPGLVVGLAFPKRNRVRQGALALSIRAARKPPSASQGAQPRKCQFRVLTRLREFAGRRMGLARILWASSLQ